jgi:hypothetical protein
MGSGVGFVLKFVGLTSFDCVFNMFYIFELFLLLFGFL